jgi:hypothetical protein
MISRDARDVLFIFNGTVTDIRPRMLKIEDLVSLIEQDRNKIFSPFKETTE